MKNCVWKDKEKDERPWTLPFPANQQPRPAQIKTKRSPPKERSQRQALTSGPSIPQNNSMPIV
jgi:hypothetical protein